MKNIAIPIAINNNIIRIINQTLDLFDSSVSLLMFILYVVSFSSCVTLISI